MSKYKALSHEERLLNKKYRNKTISDLCKCSSRYVEEQVLDNGRILYKTVTKEYDPREVINKYKVSDFTIENLQAAGALAQLKTCNMSGNVMDNIDRAVATLDGLSNLEVE